MAVRRLISPTTPGADDINTRATQRRVAARGNSVGALRTTSRQGKAETRDAMCRGGTAISLSRIHRATPAGKRGDSLFHAVSHITWGSHAD